MIPISPFPALSIVFDLNQLKKFLYSQHAYTGLRMTLGTVLPAVILILCFDQRVYGLAFALGAYCTGWVDVPGSLKRKHWQMLGTTVVVGVISLLTLLALPLVQLQWLMLLVVSFFGGWVVIYGPIAAMIGNNALLAMVLVFAERGIGIDLWVFFAWLVAGGIWYTYFNLLLCRVWRHQMARRALAECLFATADYFTARSQCYMPEIPLEQCYRAMTRAQVMVIDTQNSARDLVLDNLQDAGQVIYEPQRIRLYNVHVDVVDMHDVVLATQGNFELLRTHFAAGDALDFLRDVLHKAARELARVAEAVVTEKPLLYRFNAQAELRALAYEVQAAQNRGESEAALVLQDALRRVQEVSDIMEKLLQDLSSTTNTSDMAMEDVVVRFTRPHPLAFSWRSAFSLSSPALRYALRLTIAMAVGMAASELIGGHSNWILLTIMMVMRPGFGLTQQRNQQRVLGTLSGCAAAVLLLWGIADGNLFWLMLGAWLLTFCFARLNYLVTVFFMTIGVLLLYHFLAPGWALIGQRLLDTLLGAAIGALATAYLFPVWESQLLTPLVERTVQRCREYVVATFLQQTDTLHYRLVRRDVLSALTDLSSAHLRMLQDPPAQQQQVHEVGEFVVACTVLVAEVSAVAHMRVKHPEIVQVWAFKATEQQVLQTLALDESATLVAEYADMGTREQLDVLRPLPQSAQRVVVWLTRLQLPGMRAIPGG